MEIALPLMEADGWKLVLVYPRGSAENLDGTDVLMSLNHEIFRIQAKMNYKSDLMYFEVHGLGTKDWKVSKCDVWSFSYKDDGKWKYVAIDFAVLKHAVEVLGWHGKTMWTTFNSYQEGWIAHVDDVIQEVKALAKQESESMARAATKLLQEAADAGYRFLDGARIPLAPGDRESYCTRMGLEFKPKVENAPKCSNCGGLVDAVGPLMAGLCETCWTIKMEVKRGE